MWAGCRPVCRQDVCECEKTLDYSANCMCSQNEEWSAPRRFCLLIKILYRVDREREGKIGREGEADRVVYIVAEFSK